MRNEGILNYLKDLEQNNNQDWFHANQEPYRAAKQEFESLIEELLLQLQTIDPQIPYMEPQSLTFKVQRDTRFSHDKSPYNPAFRAHIARKGKLPVPVGYYLMIKPGGNSFLGGGLFTDRFKEATAMIRDQIAAHEWEWERIITNPEFMKYFTVQGTALKRVPQGYDPSNSQAEYLKNKSWYLEYTLTDHQLLDSNFIEHAMTIYTKMQPFNNFINEALNTFQMPL